MLSHKICILKFIYIFKFIKENNISIPRLLRDPRANYKQSLSVLEHAKTYKPTLVTKTSLMLGVGETDKQVQLVMEGN